MSTYSVVGQTGSANAITINNSTGNVGIGTTAPSTALQVAGTVTATGYAGLPAATSSAQGVVQVDGTSISASNGVISTFVPPRTIGNTPSPTAANSITWPICTSIPSTVKRITITFYNVYATTNTGNIIMRVGTGAGPTIITPTAMVATQLYNNAAAVFKATTNSWILTAQSTTYFSGQITITLGIQSVGSYTYSITGSTADITNTNSYFPAGTITTTTPITYVDMYGTTAGTYFQTTCTAGYIYEY